MNKTTNRWVSLLVCIVLILTALPINAVYGAEAPRKFIEATPPLFDPSVGETTTISWNFEKDQTADVLVMNGNHVIATLAQGASYTGNYVSHQIQWDGKDGNGQPVQDGTYTIVVAPLDEIYSKYQSITEVTVLNANGRDMGITPNAYGDTFQVFGKGGRNQGIQQVDLEVTVDGQAPYSLTATVDDNVWYAELTMSPYSLVQIQADISSASGNTTKTLEGVRHVFRVADRIHNVAALYYGDPAKAEELIQYNNIPANYINDGKLVNTNLIITNPTKVIAQDIAQGSDSKKQHLGIIDQLQRIASANPSSLTMGNNFYASADLEIEGSQALFFNRMYNSMSYSYHEFGINWSHTYNYYLQDMDEVVAILFEDGHVEYYAQNSDGSYQGAEGLARKLVKNRDDSFTLTVDGTKNFEFASDGKLTSVADLNGNTLHLTYEGELLSRVDNLSGSLNFAYNGDGTLKAVTDHTGRQVSYDYINGLVAAYTNEAGHITTYEYDALNRLSTVTSPEGIKEISVVYDEQDRVTEKRTNDLGIYGYTYDDANRKITVTEPNGNQITYAYTADHKLASETYTDGTVNYYYEAGQAAPNTISTTLEPEGPGAQEGYVGWTTFDNQEPGFTKDWFIYRGVGASTTLDNTAKLTLQTYNMNQATGSTTNNTLYPQFKIINTGSADINLSDVTLRYYYTVDGDKPQNFWCDYANIGGQNVVGKFVKLDTPFNGADYYLEISFLSGAGTLPQYNPQNEHETTAVVHARIAKNDWSNYTPGDDYSQNLAAAFTSFDQVDLFYQGQLAWGKGSTAPGNENGDSGGGNQGGDTGNQPNPGSDNGGGDQSGENGSGGSGAGEEVMIPSGTNRLKLQLYNTGNSGAETNTIHPMMRLINTGTNIIKLEDITLRYYYTKDDNKPQNFWCDWSSAGPQNITGVFKELTEPFDKADNYLEIGFKAGSGYINLAESLDIHVRIGKNDWSNYDLTNDFSLNPGESFVDWDKVDVFVQGEKVWGQGLVPGELPQETEESIAYANTTFQPVRAEMYNTKTEETTNFLAPRFRIYNTSNQAIKLSDLNIKYFYTADGADAQVFEPDYGAIGGNYQIALAKSDIKADFTRIDDNNLRTNSVANISFTREDILVQPGQYVELHTRIHRSNWTNYLQSNDFSLNPTGTNYEAWHKIAVFVDGKWAWGSLPLSYAAIAEADTSGEILIDSKLSYQTETDKAGSTTRYTYDSNGNILSITDALGNQTTYTYNSFNQVTSVIDALGNKTEYSYDTKGNLTSTTDPLGNTTRLEYNQQGQVVKTIHPDGTTQTSQYDSKGNLTGITDPLGNTTHYTYDALNRATQQTDAKGNTYQYAYHPDGSLKTVTDPLGNQRSIQYNQDGKTLSTTDAKGGITQYTYNTTTGLLESQTNALDQVTHYHYDTMGQLQTMTDPKGGKTTYDYDGFGRVKTITDSLGGKTHYTYDVNSNLTKETDPAGKVTHYTYDKIGQLQTITDALGNVTRYTYDALGRTTKITDPKGNATTYGYDKNGRLVNTTDALGNITTNQYDSRGRLVTRTDAKGSKTTYQYDSAGNQIKVTDPKGNITQWTYDQNNNLEAVTDALGGVTRYTYDPLNRVTSIQDAKGSIVRYTYDANSNQESIQDPKGNKTQYQYNGLNQLTQVTDPLGYQTQYEYDAIGNLAKVTRLGQGSSQSTQYEYDQRGQLTARIDASGKTEAYAYDQRGFMTEATDQSGEKTQYQYDAMGQLTKVTYSDGKTVAYTYDANSQMNTLTDWEGTTTYTYDALGRTTAVTDVNNRTINYTWTQTGQKATMTYPDGQVVPYEYDTANNLTKVTDTGSGETNYSYDVLNRVIEEKQPNGASSQNSFDSISQLIGRTEKTGTVTREAYTYSYDANGNRTQQIREAGGQTETTSYTYDALNQLTKVTDNQGSRTYTYDAFNNRTTKEETGQSIINYQYNSLNQLIEEKQGSTVTTYTYDPRGNQTEAKENGTVTAQYTFDVTNKLTQAEVNGKETEYTYDGQGNRINVKVAEKDPTNPANQTIIADTDFLIDPMTTYNEIVAAIDNQEQKTSLYTYGKGRVSVEVEGEVSYYVNNEQGSVTDILDVDGNIQVTLKYDEFGILENPEAVSTSGNIFAYTGHVYDESTGLYYAKARYYEAEAGRFIQEDAYHGDGLNLYVYVRNNPVRFVDPSGYVTTVDADGGGTFVTLYSNKRDLVVWEKSIVGKIIVIDPGHGGDKNGAIRVFDNITYYEKQLNLEVALIVKNDLEARGAKVIMTRTTDVDVSLDDRYELANASNADIFVSIHFNSSNFWWRGSTVVYAENHDVEVSRDLARAINGSIFEWTSLDINSVYKDRRGLAVLRGTNMPAVITETGYMSSNDIEYIVNNTEEIAYAIAQGINQYFWDKYPLN